jgi:hypothetical protein
VSAPDWHEQNGRYLTLSLAWLRLLLEQRAEDPVAPADAEVAAADAARTAAAHEMIAPPALETLARRFGMSDFERDVLLLCVAMELDTRTAELCARVQGPELPHPTFALAFMLFGDAEWNALSPERPLRYWRLVEITQPGGRPLTTSALRADERIVNEAKGLRYLDDRITPLLAPLDEHYGALALPPSQQELVETLVRRLTNGAELRTPPVVNLLGDDVPSKQLVASRVAAQLDLDLVRLPVSLLPDQVGELETLARLWQRESALMPVALYLDASDGVADGPADRQAPPLVRFLARSNGLFFLDSREPWPGLSRQVVLVDVARPTAAEQQQEWSAALGPEGADAARALAAQFDLDVATIRQNAAAAGAGVGEALERVWAECVLSTRPRLEALATRLEPKAGWDDLVLRAENLALLHQIAEQVRRRPTVYDDWGFRSRMDRGLGVTALFAGDSGTGKTMAAGVIANELGLDLYHIDLSGVVSKYIGETEKNLRRVFDAAERGGAILFFDEADALFGKRSEVKDSHDRYANIEVNYLLQRMEAYRGLAILATNMKSALDPAFLRRLRFVVDFQFPGVAEREAIWSGIFPDETPVEGLELDRLARFVLTGGSIQNAALNAAFLAAEAERPVTMPLALAAVRTEFRKLERPINEGDFAWSPDVEAPA